MIAILTQPQEVIVRILHISHTFNLVLQVLHKFIFLETTIHLEEKSYVDLCVYV